MEAIGVVSNGLQLVAGFLRSKFSTHVAPKILGAEAIETMKPQLDQIQTSINDLVMKDQKVAQDLFDDAVSSMRIKFRGVSSNMDESLKYHSDRIENDLKSAQEKALAANHSGLKTKEKLDSFKWIIVTEMLRVLNEETSKGTLEYADMKKMETVVAVAREKCFKYLKKANEIAEITNFVASKIPIDGFEASWKLWSADLTEQLCQLLHMNLQTREFFRVMEDKYVSAATEQVEGCQIGTEMAVICQKPSRAVCISL